MGNLFDWGSTNAAMPWNAGSAVANQQRPASDAWVPSAATMNLSNQANPNTVQARNGTIPGNYIDHSLPFSAPTTNGQPTASAAQPQSFAPPANPVAGGTYQQMDFNGQKVFQGPNGTYLNGDGSVNQAAGGYFASQNPTRPAPPTAPSAPSINSPDSVFKPYADALAGNINYNQGFVQDLRSRLTGEVNPYNQGSDSFHALQNQTMGNVANSYAGADHSLRAQLAARGMLGGGEEGVGYSNIAAQEAGAQSQAQNTLLSQLNDKSNAFEQHRLDSLGSLAHGDYSGSMGGLRDLLSAGLGANQQQFGQGVTAAKLPSEIGLTQAQAGSLNVGAQKTLALLPAELRQAAATANLTENQMVQAKWLSDNQWWLTPAQIVAQVANGAAHVAGAAIAAGA